MLLINYVKLHLVTLLQVWTYFFKKNDFKTFEALFMSDIFVAVTANHYPLNRCSPFNCV